MALFTYRAGDDLSGATFSRASVATFVEQVPADLRHYSLLDSQTLTAQATVSPSSISHTHTLEATTIFIKTVQPDPITHGHTLDSIGADRFVDVDGGDAIRTAAASPANTVTHLVELTYFDGVTEKQLRLTTAGQNIVATVPGSTSADTFVGVGDGKGGSFLQFDSASESNDESGQGMGIRLSGVSSTMVELLLNNDFRGRDLRIWRAWWSSTSGELDAGPHEIFRGFQNSDYKVKETPGSDGSYGQVTISTRVASRLAVLQVDRAVRPTVSSHQEMLARAGLNTDDRFFRLVPGLIGKRLPWED